MGHEYLLLEFEDLGHKVLLIQQVQEEHACDI
jgi:hypothetical protein